MEEILAGINTEVGIIIGASVVVGTPIGILLSRVLGRMDKNRNLCNKVMEIIAGEDKVIDTKKTKEFLREIGYEGIIQENKGFYLQHTDRGANVRMGNYSVHRGLFFNSANHGEFLKYISRKDLQDYIEKHSPQ